MPDHSALLFRVSEARRPAPKLKAEALPLLLLLPPLLLLLGVVVVLDDVLFVVVAV